MPVIQKRTDINVNEYRRLLDDERSRLTQLHHDQLADTRAEMVDASENELSHTSTFDSAENEDTAAMIVDRDRAMALDENAMLVIRQIDHAIDRMNEGLYGICEVTGKPIPVERLRVIPWATMTVEAAERLAY